MSRGDWCTRPKGMNVAAEAAAATLLPGECCAGQLVLALPALFAFLCVLSLLSLLFSVLFCVFAAFGWLLWVTVRAKRSRSLHSPLSLPALLACVRTLSRSFSLFVALSRAVAILFKSFGRETLRRVCVVACQDWQQQRCGPTGEFSQSVSCQRCRRKDINVLTGHVAHRVTKLTHAFRALFSRLSIVCRKFVKSVN